MPIKSSFVKKKNHLYNNIFKSQPGIFNCEKSNNI